MRDADGLTDTATVKVTVKPVNDAPDAKDDTATTSEDTPVSVDVLANDTDPDGDALTIDAIVAAPSHGTAVIKDGKILYTPDANYHGTDALQYRVSDGKGGTDIANVTLNVGSVNDAPNAEDDSAITDEDVPVTINVLANDSDPDGDTLTVTRISTAPIHGTVAIQPDGKVLYTPDADYNGTDNFEYEISDGNGKTDKATVSIQVKPVNDAPDARDDSAATDEDVPVTIDVLANDTDPDGDVLAIDDIVSAPANGTVKIENGKILYTPNADYNGMDSFQYRVTDGNGGSDVATVTVNVGGVNDAPDAKDDAATTDEDVPVSINVLANDTDPDGDVLTVNRIVAAPGHGTAAIQPDGTILYTPNPDYNGNDSFDYEVTDGKGKTDIATVRVTVNPVNDAPIAADDTATTQEDTPVSVDVLANDTDPDGDALSIQQILDAPAHGTAKIENGQIVYTPNADYNGTDTLTYVVTDNNGGTDQAKVTINIGAENDAPVAVDDSATTDEDTPISVDVLANDTDPEGDTLTIDSIVTAPLHGTAVIENGEILYTPNPDYNGPDELVYRISDGKGGFDDAKVTLDVLPVNDGPRGGYDSVIYIEESETITIDVNKNYYDVDGDKLFVSEVVTEAGHGQVAFTPDGFLTYTAEADYSGADEFWVKISDGKGGDFVDSISIFIEETPDIVP